MSLDNKEVAGKSHQVSKLDAARRQLETAIRLYFADMDSVSIHTLSCASHEILFQIGKERNVSSIIRHRFKEYIREEKIGEVMAKMDEAANFFKHGSKGARKQLTFNPLFTETWIWDCCLMYHQFSGEMTESMQCFNVWFMMHNPQAINQQVRSKIEESNSLLKFPKQEFFEMFRAAISRRKF